MPKLDLSHLLLEDRHRALLCDLLHTHTPQAQVWAYGSRVRGGAHEGSDLDVVLRNPADLALNCDGLADLKEALQQSLLPILVDVHDWAYLPASFHLNIEQAYVELQSPTRP